MIENSTIIFQIHVQNVQNIDGITMSKPTRSKGKSNK